VMGGWGNVFEVSLVTLQAKHGLANTRLVSPYPHPTTTQAFLTFKELVELVTGLPSLLYELHTLRHSSFFGRLSCFIVGVVEDLDGDLHTRSRFLLLARLS
jgi:hypothetical protein